MTPVRIAPEPLERWATALLEAAGTPAPNAGEVARHLVFSDLRGVESHGVSRLPVYLAKIETGAIDPTALPGVVADSPTSALVDGRGGFGQVAARRATDLVIGKALESGLGAAGVRESNHCGCLGYYTMLQADAGLVGFACTNTTPSMPPHGSVQPFFGTNPLSLAAPRAAGPPLVVDLATSQAARGKIIEAAREGIPIPEGWALAPDGRPTTDPEVALEGTVLPLGGAKGSALALLVELLAGVLTGALVGPNVPRMYDDLAEPQRVGHFFLALRPDRFLSEGEFERRLDGLLEKLRGTRPAPGFDRVLAPGDLELAAEARRRREGIPLPSGTVGELADLAERYRVPLPAELGRQEAAAR